MCRKALSVLVILISFAAVAAENPGNPELKAAINKLHSMASIVNLEDLYETAQTEFTGSSKPGTHPGFAAMDFNGDKKVDYAVLLKIPGWSTIRRMACGFPSRKE